jgi:type II secretory ATPase GspE/PulE/Tfp pilus assembly ATPase PilB-like protein
MHSLEQKLVDRGLLAPEVLDKALEQARLKYTSLPAVLLESGWVPEGDLLRVMAEHYGLVFVSLEEYPVENKAVRTVSAKLAAHYGILPVKLDSGVLTIAVSNPLDLAPVEDIETNLGYRVERVLACRPEIASAVKRYYGVGAETIERILSTETDSGAAEAAADTSHDLERLAKDASVVRLVNQLFQEAIAARATDIHFEIYRDGVVIRRRIDGVLFDAHVPKDIRFLYPAIVSRIKLMSGLDIVERRLPQDGRTRVTIGRLDYDLRISVVPSIHGEDIVVRILPTTMLFDLSQLGFSEVHLDLLKSLIARPHGILFVTGPTGSGKSTTLYACLSRLNTRDRKIITIEDPVEYELRGITQTQVNAKIGLTFARALRSMLRHDPDIMMVGEVRDRETAEIAVQTAMTGHMVLSTLHTNDAASGAVRLTDMGIDPYLLTSTVLAFAAQRLVRLLCPECREPYDQDGRTLFRSHGCRACSQTGFRGRMAISEFLLLTPAIQDLIMKRSSAVTIRKEADAQGMAVLAHDGWDKVANGLTTAEEVLRVTTL